MSEDLTRWAERMLDEHARATEHLTDDELIEHRLRELADFYVLADGWLIGSRD